MNQYQRCPRIPRASIDAPSFSTIIVGVWPPNDIVAEFEEVFRGYFEIADADSLRQRLFRVALRGGGGGGRAS